MNGFSQDLLTGKTILITGGGKGIGRACVDAMAVCGAKVIAVARTSKDLDELVTQHGERIEPWVMDVLRKI